MTTVLRSLLTIVSVMLAIAALNIAGQIANAPLPLSLGFAFLIVIATIAAMSAALIALWRSPMTRLLPKIQKLLPLVAIALLSLSSVACTTRIPPGAVGIVVNASGSQRGVSDYPATTGRVWYNPFNTSIYEYPTFVQNVVWTQNPNEGRKLNEEITFTNKDKFPIAVDVNLSYQLQPDKVPAFYVKFRSDDLGQFSDTFLHSTARDVFNDVGGRYSIDEIMGDNSRFLKEVRRDLQAELTPLGVQIVQFGLIDAPRPPIPVKDAITASAEASQTALKIQNELAQTEATAKKAIAEAQGQAQARIEVADAEAEANRRIAASVTPVLVDYMKAQAAMKWNGQMPGVVTGSAVPFINVGGTGGR